MIIEMLKLFSKEVIIIYIQNKSNNIQVVKVCEVRPKFTSSMR